MIPWSWSDFYDHLISQRKLLANSNDPEFGSDSQLGSFVTSSGDTSRWYYVRVKNPEFGIDDIVRHVYHDKVQDAARSSQIAYVTQSVTAPMVMAGPPGMLARAGVTLWATFNLSHIANMYDLGRDIHDFVRSGEIGGTSLTGHSIRHS